jgi:hypothetical protein
LVLESRSKTLGIPAAGALQFGHARVAVRRGDNIQCGCSTALIASALALEAGACAGKWIRRSEISWTKARPAPVVSAKTWPPRALSEVRKWKCQPADRACRRGETETDQAAVHLGECINDLLCLDYLWQRTIRRCLLRLAAYLNGLESTVDTNRKAPRSAVRQCIKRSLQLLQRLPDGNQHRYLRVKINHNGKWGPFRPRHQMGATVGRPAVDLTIEHHHLAVHPVEGAQSKVAMAQHLIDGRVAVIGAGEQAGDTGRPGMLLQRADGAPAVSTASVSVRQMIIGMLGFIDVTRSIISSAPIAASVQPSERSDVSQLHVTRGRSHPTKLRFTKAHVAFEVELEDVRGRNDEC